MFKDLGENKFLILRVGTVTIKAMGVDQAICQTASASVGFRRERLLAIPG